MYFEQFYLGCLAHASYMLGSEGEAAVVDPQRDVEIYLTAAAERGLKIKHIFETHLHADFVSGHVELARRTGATIYIGARAGAEFPHVALRDGFELTMGKVRIRAMETPGHTPESCCLVVTDLEPQRAQRNTEEGRTFSRESTRIDASQERQESPWAVLTGDTLFIGDVGRPDLSPGITSQELAGMLYDSLHNKLMKLPDDVLVYPAHGAGSLCGRNMRADRFSTVGTERLTNYALQMKDRDEFVRQMTENLPARPDYFFQDAQINRQGATALAELEPMTAIVPAELQQMIEEDVFALDVRPTTDFARSHVPGSINIALSGQFASWAASVLGLKARPVLIADTPQQYEEARMRMARVGIEEVRGYLEGGVAAWRHAGFDTAELPEMTVEELDESLHRGGIRVLDVRREPEWQAGHIEGAQWWPLDRFRVSPPQVDQRVPLAVHCASGYRSTIACSLLQRAGFTNVVNVVGGFDAWKKKALSTQQSAVS